MTAETPLTAARRRDVEHRRQRVRKALADMHTDGSEITVAATASRAGVHRSFIHRHPDLHAEVLRAAAETTENPSPASAAISHRSALAENANLAETNRRSRNRSGRWRIVSRSCWGSRLSNAADSAHPPASQRCAPS